VYSAGTRRLPTPRSSASRQLARIVLEVAYNPVPSTRP
jgi:hypothetical protein